MKFGIDFGTTNTAVSLMRGDTPEQLSFGSAGVPQAYVPSVFAIKKGIQGKEYHGMEAKTRIGEASEDYSVYQNFKMLLGESQAIITKHWADQPLTPEEVTQKYIRALVTQIHEEHQLTPEGIVVTVPEVWINQGLHTKREHLITVFKNLGINQIRIESEPLAAASYYLHCYQKKKENPFQGHLLVCDCGGGTMDFCLVHVQYSDDNQPRMTVLERAGNGRVTDQLGSAGVAFDQTIIDRLFPGLKAQDPVEFYKCVREFEENKIIHTHDVSELLKLHRMDSALVEDEHLFRIAKQPVYANLLTEVFDKLIAPDILQALKQISERAISHNIDKNNPHHFRVLMVGGFSSFYLVQEAIANYFGSEMETDSRFENIFTLQDRSLAISKGAALIASELTEIIHTCPANVGIFARQGVNGEKKSCKVLSKGTSLEDYQKPTYFSQAFSVININDALPVYIEVIPDQPIEIMVQGQTMKSILPMCQPNDRIKVGFSVDGNMVFSLHVYAESRPHEVKKTSLGHLMANIPNEN
jgi:molecular chaperone DnaK